MRILYKSFVTLSAASVFALVLASCGASRHSDGFSYQTNGTGLDMSAGDKPKPVANTSQESQQTAAPSTTATVDALATDNQLTPTDQQKLNNITEMVKAEYQKQEAARKASGNTTPVTAGELVKNVGQQMAVSGNTTEKEAKKFMSLDKLAKKVDKMTKKHASDSFLGSGTTLLFAVIALAGLVIGIFVNWIGWVIFAVFGALWLFRKLS